MGCGCGKSREQRVAEQQARRERIQAAREAKAAKRAEIQAQRRQRAA